VKDLGKFQVHVSGPPPAPFGQATPRL
jgi:hypothetical protein